MHTMIAQCSHEGYLFVISMLVLGTTVLFGSCLTQAAVIFVCSDWGGGLNLRNTVHFWKMMDNPPVLLSLPLNLPGDEWPYLKAEAHGRHARLWYRREDVDEDYVLVYDAETLLEFNQGQIGIYADGAKVWVDYVRVYDMEGVPPQSVQPHGKLPTVWGAMK